MSIKKKIKCNICGKEFNILNNTHLKTHNITPEEYKNKFNVEWLDNRDRTLLKGIRDESLNKLKYVKRKNRPKIKCELCGNYYYRISSTHMERVHQITLEDYKDMFPNSPLYISTDEERKLISKNHADVRGKNNSQWLGGLNKNSYPHNWRRIRKLVLEYYGDICHLCGSHKHICIHHVDYDKTNNSINNFIPLCLKCHLKTNFHRDVWNRILTTCQSQPELNNEYHKFMSNHVDNLTEERINEIEEEILFL